MKRSKMSKDLLIVSILTVLTVITWITLETYWAFKKNDVPKVLKEQLEPLNPEINAGVLENLGQRRNPSKEELVQPLVSQTPTPTGTGGNTL